MTFDEGELRLGNNYLCNDQAAGEDMAQAQPGLYAVDAQQGRSLRIVVCYTQFAEYQPEPLEAYGAEGDRPLHALFHGGDNVLPYLLSGKKPPEQERTQYGQTTDGAKAIEQPAQQPSKHRLFPQGHVVTAALALPP